MWFFSREMTVSLCDFLVTLISVIEEEDDLLIVEGLEKVKRKGTLKSGWTMSRVESRKIKELFYIDLTSKLAISGL